MGMFSRKSPEEKAAAKAEKQQRNQEIDNIDRAIRSHLGKMERMNVVVATRTVAEMIFPDERILTAITGEFDGKKACLAATDQRIIIAYGITAGTIELPYRDIDRVDTGRKFSGAWIKLHTSAQSTTFDKSLSSDDQIGQVKNIVRQWQVSMREQESAPTPAASSGAAEVAKLAELHASGVLTDEEFAAAKAKALGL